jgi:phosphoenolpyruvate---glycerone phosphotransferase subunit DhaL
MTIDPDLQRRLIKAVAERVILHTDELVALDQAIGDGDHGLNMKRGFEAVLADLDKFSSLPLDESLKGVGMALVMKVGGASGPLYGSLFMALGKSLPARADRAGLAQAFAAAVDAVKARGKSDVGQKTMIDVLVPVLSVLKDANGDVPARLCSAAQAAANATIPVRAQRGRASFLGERSIGHMDPGARSAALMVCAVVDVMEDLA